MVRTTGCELLLGVDRDHDLCSVHGALLLTRNFECQQQMSESAHKDGNLLVFLPISTHNIQTSEAQNQISRHHGAVPGPSFRPCPRSTERSRLAHRRRNRRVCSSSSSSSISSIPTTSDQLGQFLCFVCSSLRKLQFSFSSHDCG